MPGDQDADTHRQSHGQCDQDQIDLKAEAYGGKIFFPKHPTDDNTVSQIIKLLKYITDQNGK